LNAARGQIDTSVLEIRGFVASVGHAKGTVKVIQTIEDASKLQVGDVLVISMTRPEHTIFMKKSAAIITDDGGITSHAAIVSRELGKPCIIGTKIATQVLKDGDEVEVDANKGIVKVFKRAQAD
jgi:pyruvate,water dikinase